ncbi:DUF3027 domain-containing protein [Amycolatopsis vastitatis]|uniref:DUF3027 domain-containing protein n=1 Tax=Amycolatopsis vastitatis TaxID=1905142 RepID=A0A229T1D6_9PSEU|nr:DUF3027 domain-containing protein [Amycolatopsis vastitatis]OXM65058.1 hypothetical protein CF165_24800 [Amycolatopsis vastitatis]
MTLLLTLDDGSVQRKLADAVEFARAAVLENSPEEQLGAHVGVTREDAVTASHLFEAQVPGYGGWRWSVTVALAGDDEPVTVSEVVLVPGPDALIAPPWVPWERRVRAGDLGVGDIFPTDENDPRLAPAYLQSDDPAVEEVAHDAGLGRIHVLSRFGRTEAATRWHGGEFGPRSDMARSAPDVCGTCGFFVPLAGSLRGRFGVCSNDIAPADGHVVDVEYGCGAHSEVEVELTSSVPVAELVYDDSLLDYTPAPEVVETAAAEPETGVAESDVSPAEVEPEIEVELLVEPVEAEPVEAEPVEVEPEIEVELLVEPVEAEPVEAEPESAAVAEQVEPVAAVAEPVAPEAAEPDGLVAEPQAAEAGAVAEPQTVEADATAEPVVAEVPEPAEAEPTQAEVTDSPAPSESATEPQSLDEPVPEAAQVEVAESPEASASEAGVPEPAEAEPTQAEVTDAVAEPQAEAPEPAEAEPTDAVPPSADAEVPEAAVAGNVVTGAEDVPAAAEVPEPAEAEPTQAEVSDAVPTHADEAQARVDEVTGDQRDA